MNNGYSDTFRFSFKILYFLDTTPRKDAASYLKTKMRSLIIKTDYQIEGIGNNFFCIITMID